MRKSAMNRIGLLGSAAALAMVGLASGAQAYSTSYGDFEITFDTTISVGTSMKTQERNTLFLNEANGGPVDPRTAGVVRFSTPGLVTGNIFDGVVAANNSVTLTNNPFNYDGSVNTDDGRLNFDQGDLTGANVKASHDLQIKWQNLTFFARAVGFYDAVLNNPDAGDHGELIAAGRGNVGRNYDLLDAYLSGDFDVVGLPVNLRVGKQVISWGESTFILNGINVFNPIDVGAFRRPGSEIKEALTPVNAIFGSVSLPFDVSIAGYYALDWEPFTVDPSGTPFSTVDVAAKGSGFGGNRDRVSFVTGSPFSGNRRNCAYIAGSGTRVVQNAFLFGNPNAGALGNGRLECSDDDALGGIFAGTVSHIVPYTIGQHEAVRIGLTDLLSADGMSYNTQAALVRNNDEYARDDGQYGLTVRYLADWLDGAELAAYYQKYHSRLPILGIGSSGATTAQLAYFTYGSSANASSLTQSGLSTKLLGNAGCWGLSANIPTFYGSKAGAMGVTNGVFSTMAAAAQVQMKGTPVADPGGLLTNFIANLGANGWSAVGLGLDLVSNGGLNQYNVAKLNCVMEWYQSAPIALLGGTPQTFDGAETFNANLGGATFLTYPEDIEQWGGSFSATILGWGVQGEASYRPNAPFQADTDGLTISQLIDGCVFNTLFGLAGQGSLEPGGTPDGSGARSFCGSQRTRQDPVIRNQMYTAQIGTTATFTGSEPLIEMVGADLGILLTELGVVNVPGVEDTWISSNALNFLKPQYQNTGCNGTDLPLAGALSLDVKTSRQCRPTDTSAGYVLVGVLQYNNAFGSGYVVSPLVAFSHDFYGTTPSPYGNYVEDRMSVSAQVSATLNNNFRLNLGYTNFFGGHINNKNQDLDFASFSASYSF